MASQRRCRTWTGGAEASAIRGCPSPSGRAPLYLRLARGVGRGRARRGRGDGGGSAVGGSGTTIGRASERLCAVMPSDSPSTFQSGCARHRRHARSVFSSRETGARRGPRRDAVVDRHAAARLAHVPLVVDVRPGAQGGARRPTTTATHDRDPDRRPHPTGRRGRRAPPRSRPGRGLHGSGPRRAPRWHPAVAAPTVRPPPATEGRGREASVGDPSRPRRPSPTSSDDHGDVVVTARLVGRVDQPVARGLGVGLAARGSRGSASGRPCCVSPSRAQQEAVAGLEVQRQLVDLQASSTPRARVRMLRCGWLAGLVGREPPSRTMRWTSVWSSVSCCSAPSRSR